MPWPIFYEGSILFRDGALAMSLDCCCDVPDVCCAVCPELFEAYQTIGQTLNITNLDEPGGPQTDTLVRGLPEPGNCVSFENVQIFYGEFSMFIRLNCGDDGLTLDVRDAGETNCFISGVNITTIDCPRVEFSLTLIANPAINPPACPYIGEVRRFVIEPTV